MFREIQIKITMRCCHIAIRMAIRKEFKKFDTCVEKLEPSYIAGGKVKWYSHFDEQLAVPQKVRH